MGSDPKTSVVNRYGQSWDVPNLFVIGSSTFPSMSGFNRRSRSRRSPI